VPDGLDTDPDPQSAPGSLEEADSPTEEAPRPLDRRALAAGIVRSPVADSGNPGQPARIGVDFPPGASFRTLCGELGVHFEVVSDALGVAIRQRGERVLVQGSAEGVQVAADVLVQLFQVADLGQLLTSSDVDQACRMLRAEPDVRLDLLFRESIPIGVGRKRIHPRSIRQRAYISEINSHTLTFGVGPAGTGKTFLAMAMALASLFSEEVQRIILCRPAVEAGEKLGFLPGDLTEKVNPYLRPLLDALHDLSGYDKAQRLLQRGTIEVAPIAFMRGRTLSDAFVILDEAQNTTAAQMKMFLTRIGRGSKVVVTGDVTQIDLPRGTRSGLVDALRVLEGVPRIGRVHFTDIDVVRHPLVSAIIRAYDRDGSHQ
jgi:phosphate starvation-inducible PhoH-like protein